MHSGPFSDNNVRPLATLLELHKTHASSILNSNGYRDDTFKPSGGAWNDYGMDKGGENARLSLYSDTTANSLDDNNNNLMRKWGNVANNGDVSQDQGVTREFRGYKLLPSGGVWADNTNAARPFSSDKENTNTHNTKYVSSDVRYLIGFLESQAGETTEDPAVITAPGTYRVATTGDIHTTVEEKSVIFKNSTQYKQARIDEIGQNTSWENYTSGIMSDLEADGETKIFT